MGKSQDLHQSPTNSLFQESWWLEAVAPGQWDEIVIKRGDTIVARFPYVLKKRYGYNLIVNPNLTQTLGPWIHQTPGKHISHISNQRKLLNELIDNLPHFDFFHQNFYYSVTDWLPFYWRDFQQTTMYTYVLENLSNINNIWDNVAPAVRNRVRKAEKFGIKIEQSDNIDLFLELNKLTFARQGMPYIYSVDYIKRFDSAAKLHNARAIFLAYDTKGRFHAGVYLLHDDRSAYLLMGGSDPSLRSSGAHVLAIWEAIKFAATVSQVFDFEGSISEPIERFFRSFGAIQKPYFKITKYNSLLLKAAYSIKNSNLVQHVRRII